MQRLYLDELDDAVNQSLGIEIMQLIVETEAEAPEQARQLLQRAEQELEDVTLRREIIDLIETIVLYKFTRMSREEIEAMLGLNELKQTKVYQEALEEGEIKGRLQGKLEAVVPLLERGFAVEAIAEILGLEIEQVRVAAQNPDITNKA